MTRTSSSLETRRNAMYCLTPSMRFWNSTLATFMLLIILPILPTIVAKINTPARKSATTNRYSASFSGWGVSPASRPNGTQYAYKVLTKVLRIDYMCSTAYHFMTSCTADCSYTQQFLTAVSNVVFL